VQARPEELPRLLKSMLASMFALAFPYVAALAVLGPAVFPVVFGSSWAEAGVYARMLAVMVLFQNLGSPVSGTLDVLERQDLNLAGEVARAAVMLGAVALARHLHLAPRLGVALLSAAGTVSQLVLLGSCVYAVWAWRLRGYQRSTGRQHTEAR
jgi:O-antigen/teichoic acid export membrane protein